MSNATKTVSLLFYKTPYSEMWHTNFNEIDRLRRIIYQIKACRRLCGIDTTEVGINLYLMHHLSPTDFAFWTHLQDCLETLALQKD